MEDCLVDRLWTDLEASKKLVDNINTLFQSTTTDQEDEGEGNVIGRKLLGTQGNKPQGLTAEDETGPSPVPTKTDPASFPLDNVKVEQRLTLFTTTV